VTPNEGESNLEYLQRKLCAVYPDLCPMFSIEYADCVLVVPCDMLHTTAANLKELGFERFGFVTAVDRGAMLELVYRLQSSHFAAGIFLKTEVPRDEAVTDTLTDLWPAADWQEREVFDLFGIDFRGHPDMRRILLPDDWVGYPLRKDYHDDSIIPRPDYI
jgi:NADH-quinone oxidoreductase subunit C